MLAVVLVSALLSIAVARLCKYPLAPDRSDSGGRNAAEGSHRSQRGAPGHSPEARQPGSASASSEGASRYSRQRAGIERAGHWPGARDPGEADGGRDSGEVKWPPTAGGVREAVESIVPDVERCYRGWLQTNPELQGRTTLRVAIAEADTGQSGEEAGRQITEMSALVDGVEHPEFEACVKNTLVHLQFEGPVDEQPVEVLLPFQFTSHGPQTRNATGGPPAAGTEGRSLRERLRGPVAAPQRRQPSPPKAADKPAFSRVAPACSSSRVPGRG